MIDSIDVLDIKRLHGIESIDTMGSRACVDNFDCTLSLLNIS